VSLARHRLATFGTVIGGVYLALLLRCDNIHSWISLSGDFAFSHQDGIYGCKFPERFLEISSRDLTLSSDLITNPSVPFSFAFARLNALQSAVRHFHSYQTQFFA